METASPTVDPRPRGRMVAAGALVLVLGLAGAATALASVIGHSAATSAACTRTWIGTGSANWTVPLNWSPVGVPDTSDYVCLLGNSINITVPVATSQVIAGLRLDGEVLTVAGSLTVSDTSGTKSSEFLSGTLSGAGNFTIGSGHTFTWTGGTMDNAGVTTIAAGGTLVASPTSAGDLVLTQRSVMNNGTFTLTPNSSAAKTLFMGGAPCEFTRFTNNGTFRYVGANSHDPGITACGDVAFINAGTFTKTAGTGSATIQPSMDNEGTLSSQAGKFTLRGTGGGSANYGASPGATVSLAIGSFTLGAGSTFTGGVSIDGATVSIGTGGTLTMSGTNSFTKGNITGPGTVTVNGTLTWSGGLMDGSSGSTTIAAGGVVNATVGSVADVSLHQRTFTNNGMFTLVPNTTVGRTLKIGADTCQTTTFTNNGTFVYNTAAANDPGIGGCGIDLLRNNGTFTKATGTTGTITAPFDNDGTVTVATGTLSLTGGDGALGTSVGTFAAAPGAVLAFTVGDYHLATGSALTGTARISGANVIVNSSTSFADLTLASGTLDGVGAATVNGTLTWTGGIMQGAGSTVIAAGATANVTPGAASNLVLNKRAWVNNGTTNVTPDAASGHTLFLGGDTCQATALTNNGTFIYNGLSAADPGIASCGTATIVNTGAFTKATGAGTTTLQPVVQQNGTMTAQAGQLVVTGSGTGTAAYGAAPGAGISLAAGNIVLAAGSTFTGGVSIDGASVSVATGGSLVMSGINAFTSGNLTGPGSLTVTGTLNWSGGLMDGPDGSTTVAAGGALNATPGSIADVTIHQRAFTNNGTFTLTPNAIAGRTLRLGTGTCQTTTFTNNGSFLYAASGAGDPGIASCGNATLRNNGTFTKATGGSATISPAFDNDGAVAVNTGTLSLTGGDGTLQTTTGTFTAAPGAVVAFTAGDYHLAAGSALTGTTVVDGGDVIVNAGTSFSNLSLTAGTVDGAGTATITGTLSWTGGVMQGAGATVISPGATADLVAGPAANLALSKRSWVNNGTTNVTPDGASGHTLFVGGDTCLSTVLTNNGTFNYNGLDSADPGITSCGTATVVNTGTFVKTAGAATTTLQPVIQQAGTLTAQAGTLVVTGSGTATGAYGAAPGATISLASGNITLAAGSTFTGGVSIDGATISIANGGSLTMTGTNAFTSGNITGPGSLTVNGTLNWSGGLMDGSSGSTTIAASGAVNAALGTAADATIHQRAFTNNGTFTLTPNAAAGRTLRLGSATCQTTTFTNNGTFVYNAAAASDPGIASCGNATLRNNGTITKATGATAAVSPAFDNDGTVAVNAGTLALTGGGGNGQTSAGTFAASPGAATAFSGGDFHLAAGSASTGNAVVNGANVIVNAATSFGDLNFSAGTLDGVGAVTVTGTLTWTGGVMQGTGSTVVAPGATANLLAGPAANLVLSRRTLVNYGTTNVTPDAGSGHTLSLGGASCLATVVTNNGAFNFNGPDTGDPGITSCGTASVVNNGTFTKATGTATTNVQSTFDNNGTLAVLVGTLRVSGSFPAWNSTNFTLNKGTYELAGALQWPNAVINRNLATVRLSGPDATITNTNGDDALDDLATNSAPGSFTVAGGKSQTVRPFANSSTVVVELDSTLTVANGAYVQSSGSTTVNGTLASTGITGAVTSNGGVFGGVGTVVPSLTAAGTVDPGAGAQGILSVSGSYTQTSTASMQIELGGTVGGAGGFAGYDQLQVGASASLSGSLTVTALAGFTPTVGEVFTIATYASHSGCFTSVAGLDLDQFGPGYYLEFDCGANAINVTVARTELTVDDVSVTEGDAGTQTMTFTVTPNHARGDVAMSADWATTDGTATAPDDYAAAGGTLSWLAGDATPRQVAVTVNGDTLVEGDETFTVDLSGAANVALVDGSGLGTIVGDDLSEPVITGFSAPSANIGKPVTVLGSGFTGATAVTFSQAGGGTVSAPFTVADDGHVTATVPNLATTGPVTVTTPGGTATSPTAFKVKASVKSFAPPSGPVGTVVTLTGSAFTGTTKVTFNGKSAVFVVVSDTLITATVPTGATTGKIAVTTAGGTVKSKTNYTVV